MDLVKTVGQPVRDKLMADGVVLAWGVESTMLRVPGDATHFIWYAVADWSGVDKVDTAMRAQIAKLSEEGAKAGAAKKGQKPAGTVMDRLREDVDISKIHDYLTRSLVFAVSPTPPPAGLLPYTRYNFVKVKPGKGGDYRKAWEKYNKPVLDKLVADGVIGAFGLTVEEVRTSGDFTHFTWYDTKELGGMDKIRAAFIADRERRTQEEQEPVCESAGFGRITRCRDPRADIPCRRTSEIAPRVTHKPKAVRRAPRVWPSELCVRRDMRHLRFGGEWGDVGVGLGEVEVEEPLAGDVVTVDLSGGEIPAACGL